MKWTSHKMGERSRGDWRSKDGVWRIVSDPPVSGWERRTTYWWVERWTDKGGWKPTGTGRFDKLAKAKAHVEELVEQRYGLAPLPDR